MKPSISKLKPSVSKLKPSVSESKPARPEAGRAAKGHQTTKEGKQFTRKHETNQPDHCHAGPSQRTQRDIERKRETKEMQKMKPAIL